MDFEFNTLNRTNSRLKSIVNYRKSTYFCVVKGAANPRATESITSEFRNGHNPHQNADSAYYFRQLVTELIQLDGERGFACLLLGALHPVTDFPDFAIQPCAYHNLARYYIKG